MAGIPPENPHSDDRYRDARNTIGEADTRFGIPARHWSHVSEMEQARPDPDPREALVAERASGWPAAA